MEAGESHWSRIQERGSMLGLRFTVACYQLFGRFLALPLVVAVVSYFFLTDHKGRAASHAFMERLQQVRPNPDWAPGLRESFRHYREFAFQMADRVELWGGRQDAFEFLFHGREHFKTLREQGKGAILFGAHLGSFDALRVLSSIDGVKVNVLMYTAHAPKINEVFRQISPDADMRVISADPNSARTTFEIKACVDRGEWVAILADRIEPGDRHRVVTTDFLGAPARFPESPFLLPVVLGCPALMILALRRGSRTYEVFAEPLADEAARASSAQERASRARDLCTRYAERLEHYCGRAHQQWFNFYDFWAEGAE